MSSQSIEWVLFDWGNVLIEYRPGGLTKLAHALGTSEREIHGYIAQTGIVRGWSDGSIDVESGLDRFAERFGKRLTRAEAVDCFRQETERVLSGVDELLDDLEGVARTGILSNAFFGHWDAFVATDLYNRFELPMASHLLGCLKPDDAIYEAALERMGAEASRVVFIDDRQENLDAADALGMRTILSHRSVPTTRAGLAEWLGPLRSKRS